MTPERETSTGVEVEGRTGGQDEDKAGTDVGEEKEDDKARLDIEPMNAEENVKILVTRLHAFELREGSICRVENDAAKLNCEVVNCYIELVCLSTL